VSEKFPAVHSKKENAFLVHVVNVLLSLCHERGLDDLPRQYRFGLNGNVYHLYANYNLDCFSSLPLFKCQILPQSTSRPRPSI
jgi:hypothetical protein